MAKNNAFDDLLASFTDDGTRKALADIADKEPKLREAVMLRSDYSRSLDEFKTKEKELSGAAERAKNYEGWYSENWVKDAFGEGKGGTKRELDYHNKLTAAEQRALELESKLQLGGEVTFDQLTEHLGKLGYARQDAVEAVRTELNSAKSGVEKVLNESLMGHYHVAVKAPKIALKHFRTFNEEVDIDEVVQHATKNGIADLEKAYDSFVAPKVNERNQKAQEEAVKAAEKAGYEKAMSEKGMSPGSMPTDNNPPTMGHFQQKLMGVREGANGEAVIPDNAELGSGAVAMGASRNWGREGS
jgi:hypothetical protein